jgi:hypothetical protein
VPSTDLAAGAARGADSPVIGMRPLTCAGCGGRETEIRITATSKGAVSAVGNGSRRSAKAEYGLA